MKNEYAGTTVNERLFIAGLIDEFDNAVNDKDYYKAKEILKKVELTDESIIPILESLKLFPFSQKYNSVINKVFISKNTTNKYDITLKPKMVVLDMFPSFFHIEIEVNDTLISINKHYHFIVYTAFALMTFFIFLLTLSIDSFYAVVLQVIVIVILKTHGYYQLEKIARKMMFQS